MEKLIKQKIIDRIQDRQLQMKPRWHFIIRSLARALLITVVFACLLYLLSFFFFAARGSGTWYLISFGWRGFGLFLASLPWVLLLVVFILILIVETMLRRFGSGWRRSFVYGLLLVALLSVGSGWLISQSPLHRSLYHKSWEEDLPLVGPLYRHYARWETDNVYLGEIIDLGEDFLVLQTDDGEEMVFDRLPDSAPWTKERSAGQRVMAITREVDGQLYLWRLRPFEGGLFNHRGRPPEINSDRRR